jgi:hypothetical protein
MGFLFCCQRLFEINLCFQCFLVINTHYVKDSVTGARTNLRWPLLSVAREESPRTG